MKFLHDRVPNMDAVVELYVREALTPFERQAYFAAAVMLGAASEKALYLLADAILGALKNPTSKQTLRDLLQGRSVNQLFMDRPGCSPCDRPAVDPTYFETYKRYQAEERAVSDPTTLILVDEADRLQMTASSK
jgi:hypothetical protein